jgi:hypothetical protein
MPCIYWNLTSGDRRKHDAGVNCVADLEVGRKSTSETSAIQHIHMQAVPSLSRIHINVELHLKSDIASALELSL